MTVPDELVPVLKKLRLSGVLQTLELRMKEAVDDSLPYPEFLYRLCQDEVDRRESKQLELRLRRANFDGRRSLEDFDFQFNPQVPKTRIIDLATTRFVDSHENVLLIGPAGVGKSHIAQALGERACKAGHSTLYVSAHAMLTSLRAARADHSYDRKILRFTTPDLLIVDDLGLRPLEGDEPIDLYEIIRQRYEHGSLIPTSNRALAEWYPLFLDDLLASAAMDRLLHHAHVVVIEGHSYRNPPAARRRSAGACRPSRTLDQVGRAEEAVFPGPSPAVFPGPLTAIRVDQLGRARGGPDQPSLDMRALGYIE